MELRGFSTLKQLVSDALIDTYGNVDQGRYFQLLRWAVRKYIDLKIHQMPQNKTVKLTVQTDPYCVKLPGDYVSFRGIGTDKNGLFYPFDEDPNMATYVGEDCGAETQGEDEQQTTPVVPVWYTYSLDEQNQRVLIHGYPYLDDAILLYVSTGVNIGGETVVPAKVYEVILSWLHYMLAKHAGVGDVNEAWAAHLREVNKFDKTKFNIDAMYAVLYDVANKKTVGSSNMVYPWVVRY